MKRIEQPQNFWVALSCVIVMVLILGTVFVKITPILLEILLDGIR